MGGFIMQETIGRVIRRLRKERGFTQEDLADALGVTAQAISKWENDVGIPDVSHFVPIANLFDVSIDVLFSRKGKSTDIQVKELLNALDCKNINLIQEFEELSEALLKYPNHPDLLYRIVFDSIFLVESNDKKQSKTVLSKALKAADSFIRYCKDAGEIVRMKMMKINLLVHAGCYTEAEILAQEFDIPIITQHCLFARICRGKKELSEEIRHRQESIAQILPFLMNEISELGIAYQMNGYVEEALYVHSINLKLPYLIHEKGSYHAPLQNSHLVSGFDAAYCLLLLGRHEEAVDLLEKIFEYASMQCDGCRNHEPLISPLLCSIDMNGYYGEMLKEDYLWKIKAEEFSPLHDNPKFKSLLNKYEGLQKQS